MDERCTVCGFTIYREGNIVPKDTFAHVLPAYERGLLWPLAHQGDGVYIEPPNPDHVVVRA